MACPDRIAAAELTANPLDAALQAGSAALIELQLAYAQTRRPDLRRHVTKAIEALRAALAEVRVAGELPHGPLAYGFVTCAGELDDPKRPRPVAG